MHVEKCLYEPWLAISFGCQKIVQKCTLFSCRFIITCGFPAWCRPSKSLRFPWSCAVQLSSLADFLHTPVIIVTKSVCDMTYSKTGSAVKGSDSSVELVSVSDGMSVRYSSVAQFGLSLVFPCQLKFAFPSRVPAMHLLPLVFLDQNLVRHFLFSAPRSLQPDSLFFSTTISSFHSHNCSNSFFGAGLTGFLVQTFTFSRELRSFKMHPFGLGSSILLCCSKKHTQPGLLPCSSATGLYSAFQLASLNARSWCLRMVLLMGGPPWLSLCWW